MHFTKLPLAAVLLAYIAAGAFGNPLTGTKTNQRIRIEQVRGGKKPPVPVQLLQTYERYGKTPPKALVAAAAAAKQTGSVSAPYDNFRYVLPVQVGSGKSSLGMDFDTGSSDFWVFSKLQPANQTAGHTVYNLTGTRVKGQTWDIVYADGSGASGVVYADKVVLGGVTATSQAVEAASSVSAADVSVTEVDGVAGFAFGSANNCTPKCTTLFNTLAPTLAAPVFTAALRASKPGTVTLGYIDPTLKSGPITYVPALNNSFFPGLWGFSAGAYSFSNNGTTHTGTIGDAVIDSGTTIWVVPASVSQAYWSLVQGAIVDSGLWIFPCTSASTLPNLHVTIGAAEYSIPGYLMDVENFAIINGNFYCYGGLQNSTAFDFSIFGDVFLQGVYVVFAPQVPQIGFAQQATSS